MHKKKIGRHNASNIATFYLSKRNENPRYLEMGPVRMVDIFEQCKPHLGEMRRQQIKDAIDDIKLANPEKFV